MCDGWCLFDDVVYVYIIVNEIIYGVEFCDMLDVGDVLLFVDFSLFIVSELLDVSCYGLIYVGV